MSDGGALARPPPPPPARRRGAAGTNDADCSASSSGPAVMHVLRAISSSSSRDDDIDDAFRHAPGAAALHPLPPSISSRPTHSSSWDTASSGGGDAGVNCDPVIDDVDDLNCGDDDDDDDLDVDEEEMVSLELEKAAARPPPPSPLPSSFRGDDAGRSSYSRGGTPKQHGGGGGGGSSSSTLRRTPGPPSSSSSHRRTPGPPSSRSANAPYRRTPGAAAMHRSSTASWKNNGGGAGGRGASSGGGGGGGGGPNDAQRNGSSGGGGREGTGPGAVLGFGLALTTPVGRNNRQQPQPQHGSGAPVATPVVSRSRGGSGGGGNGGGSSSSRRPPLGPGGGGHQRELYTPSHQALFKNPHLQIEGGGRPEAFSPNTIRMTESLDKLLHEDEDDDVDDAAEAATVVSRDDDVDRQSNGIAKTDSRGMDGDDLEPSSSSSSRNYSLDQNRNEGGGPARMSHSRPSTSGKAKNHQRPPQPKPLRQIHPPGGGAGNNGSTDKNAPDTEQKGTFRRVSECDVDDISSDDDDDIGDMGDMDDENEGGDRSPPPRPLNFDPTSRSGGAFVPTTRKPTATKPKKLTTTAAAGDNHVDNRPCGVRQDQPPPQPQPQLPPTAVVPGQPGGGHVFRPHPKEDDGSGAGMGGGGGGSGGSGSNVIEIHHHHHYGGPPPPHGVPNHLHGGGGAVPGAALGSNELHFVHAAPPHHYHHHPHPGGHDPSQPQPPYHHHLGGHLGGMPFEYDQHHHQHPYHHHPGDMSPVPFAVPPPNHQQQHHHHHHVPPAMVAHQPYPQMPPGGGHPHPSWSPLTVNPYGGGGPDDDSSAAALPPREDGGGWPAFEAGYGGGQFGMGAASPLPPHAMAGHISPAPLAPSPIPPSWMDAYGGYGNGSGAMGLAAGHPPPPPIGSNGMEMVYPTPEPYHALPDFQNGPQQQASAASHGGEHRPGKPSDAPSTNSRDRIAHPKARRTDTTAAAAAQGGDWDNPAAESAPPHDLQGRRQQQHGGSVRGRQQQLHDKQRIPSRQGSRKQRNDKDASRSPPTKGNASAGAVVDFSLGEARQSDKSSPKKKSTDGPKKRNKQQQKKSGAGPAEVPAQQGKRRSNSSGAAAGDNVKRLSPEEEAAQRKRAELVESPATRLALKDFSRQFRIKEKESFQLAERFARSCLGDASSSSSSPSLPSSVHWRVYLELADLAKRGNRIHDARSLYRKVCTLQPYASQGWLEYSKLEEECGNIHKCARILREGLSYCEYNENLLTRAIKHEERVGNLTSARQILSRLKGVGIEKVWRTVLEGALLEARAGNDGMARRCLKYLMHHVPWYGPLYLEAYRLERDSDNPLDALEVVERGLNEIPRYGPLWFGAFRLCEGLDLSEKRHDLPRTMNMIDRATECISRELLWKVNLEAAQVQERALLLAIERNSNEGLDKRLRLCRHFFAKTVLSCPPNLCWKVWLAGGRMELSIGRISEARELFLQAHAVVPDKGRPAVLLECARLEEFSGDSELARAILCKARHEAGADWKVWLESVNLEVRSGNRRRAIILSQCALEKHTGTGRLWAALVQLRQQDGEESQCNALKRALRAVPKSGEVWCEGARLLMNPFVPTFDLVAAARHLSFATRFTPQYGDSFLETLRLELIDKWLIPLAAPFIEDMEQRFCDKGNGRCTPLDDMYRRIAECVRDASRIILNVTAEKGFPEQNISGTVHASTVRSLLSATVVESVNTSTLKLRCSNADPNYGLLWFHCRKRPTDTARKVLEHAKFIIASDLHRFAHIYVGAMLRQAGIIRTLREPGAKSVIQEGTDEWNVLLGERLRSAPTLEEWLRPGDSSTMLLESNVSGSNFVTGITQLNYCKPLESMSLTERRKVLFGSDSLLS